jgi:hypothetical protein
MVQRGPLEAQGAHRSVYEIYSYEKPTPESPVASPAGGQPHAASSLYSISRGAPPRGMIAPQTSRCPQRDMVPDERRLAVHGTSASQGRPAPTWEAGFVFG